MKIKLFGSLRKFVGGSPSVELTIDGVISVQDIINELNIPEQYVYMVERDGKVINKSSVINGKGELTLLPTIAGG